MMMPWEITGKWSRGFYRIIKYHRAWYDEKAIFYATIFKRNEYKTSIQRWLKICSKRKIKMEDFRDHVKGYEITQRIIDEFFLDFPDESCKYFGWTRECADIPMAIPDNEYRRFLHCTSIKEIEKLLFELSGKRFKTQLRS
jgi:hypothetical protein